VSKNLLMIIQQKIQTFTVKIELTEINEILKIIISGKSNWRGRLSMVGFLIKVDCL
jgi:hypothetical protein